MEIETYSQACQDIFVVKLTNNKKNGFFLEIGGSQPIELNNTYLLEKNYLWKGVIVEWFDFYIELYDKHRPNSKYEIKDARQINYKKILEDYSFPNNIDYLQIDLDVDNKSTLDVLEILNNTIFDEYKFATITFEHDIYTGDFFNTRELSREIFKNRGYILVFPDVKVFFENDFRPFEDWYVHPDLVDMDYVNKIKTNESLTCEEIKNILYSQ
jgi:hypothetical protein